MIKHFILKMVNAVSSRFGQTILRHRALMVLGTQLCLILAANYLAFALRFDGDIPPFYQELGWHVLPVLVLLYTAGLYAFGLFHGLWRYVGLDDFARIFAASLVSTIGLYVAVHWVLGWSEYPRSVIILTGFLFGGFVAGVRVAVRWIREWLNIIGPTAQRILVVGAGNAGALLVSDIKADPKYNYRPVGFLDDDPIKQKTMIHGVPVVGKISDLRKVAEEYSAKEIIIAIPSATPKLMQKILASTEASKIPIKTLPNVKQLLNNPVTLRRARPLSLEDLLQREPIQTDLQELHPLLEGKRVLVTGAGGSIGSELCRQIAGYGPELLVLLERHENSLHALGLELRDSFPNIQILSAIGDTTTPERISEVFKDSSPHIVFHAAAHKHVPLMEENPGEAVRNNIFGTRVVGEASLAVGVERVVLISSDKAINPTNVMGATKRVAECLVQHMNGLGRTRFTAVRFGNVLGSNGSVVPLFSEQIQKGGPLTVTHPEIMRYFMTIPESVQLVLQASVMGQGGDVFVLDMGEQVLVADLARNMIILSGMVPDQEIKIKFTGLRPGEKLYEELFEKGERREATSHEKIKRAVTQMPFELSELDKYLKEFETLLFQHDTGGVIRTLQTMIPTYTPSKHLSNDSSR